MVFFAFPIEGVDVGLLQVFTGKKTLRLSFFNPTGIGEKWGMKVVD